MSNQGAVAPYTKDLVHSLRMALAAYQSSLMGREHAAGRCRVPVVSCHRR